MPTSILPTLIFSLFAVGFSPGPANIFAMSCALENSRKQAMKAWVGMVCGFLTMAFIAAVSVHLAENALEHYIKYIKYIGAAYLLYMAWQTYKGAMKEDTSTLCTFWNGFIVQLTNAKMILFDLTVFTSFVLPYSNKFSDLMIAILWLLIPGPMANFTWIIIGSVLQKFVSKYQKTINIALALMLVGCAIMIAFF
ncbi:MAG: LysE family transporter [Bacteroidales bacterium]|nr:LysE family transporter [Bacteroidales bacterium]